MDSHETLSSPDSAGPWRNGAGVSEMTTEFVGRRGSLFWLAFRTGILTILTLGIYRFWMKTRLRRWYWSAIRPGSVPLEYTGDPFEKLLGFLIAVVFLAFYIGIVNLILMFVSFSLFQGNFAGYLLSFIGVIPLWFYARYRARRYVLARTRWRGLRFGLEKGAWGYAWRALLHWGLTIVTLGLMWPRMTFWLEKYRTDRTFYGSVRLNQRGNWKMLIRPMIHPAIGVVSSAALLFAAGGFGVAEGLPLLLITIPWLGFGLAHYKTHSFRLLTNAKSAGEVEFRSQPRTWRVFWIYTLGYGLASVSIIVLVLAVIFALAALTLGAVVGMEATGAIDFQSEISSLPGWMLSLAGILLYFTGFLLWSALTHTFVTQPLMRHFAETLTIVNPDGLSGISQRPRDEFSEAEGFAEALDVGAAI